MSQPQYTDQQIGSMTHTELAQELDNWADAREWVGKRRADEGKLPTDAKLLREAARRIRQLEDML